MKKNKIIIFDFDGVIVPSCQLSYEINKELFENLDYSEIKKWAEGNIYKKGVRENFNSSHIEYYFKEYSKKINTLKPAEGIEDVFKKILDMGYKMIIVSSSMRDSIDSFLKNYKLDQYFIEVMGTETSRSKVEKFKMIFEKYGIKGKETLIVTDSTGDVGEAKEVGMGTIGVIWGIHEKERLLKSKVDFVAEKVEEITKGIKKILVLN